VSPESRPTALTQTKAAAAAAAAAIGATAGTGAPTVRRPDGTAARGPASRMGLTRQGGPLQGTSTSMGAGVPAGVGLRVQQRTDRCIGPLPLVAIALTARYFTLFRCIPALTP